MKRFWAEVAALRGGAGWTVQLDGKDLRTPAKALLAVPGEALGKAIAAEWAAVDGEIDPREMPLTGLANAAVDHIAGDPATFGAPLARYAEGDLLCYRAESPAALAALQKRHWDHPLQWARRRFDVDFATTTGLLHVPQPFATVERLAHQVAVLDGFRLSALSPLVTLSGSLILGLALVEDAMTPDDAWLAASVDERWQLEQWGEDEEAAAVLANRRRDFMAAARFLALLSEA